jgi:hypothetical protein
VPVAAFFTGAAAFLTFLEVAAVLAFDVPRAAFFAVVLLVVFLVVEVFFAAGFATTFLTCVLGLGADLIVFLAGALAAGVAFALLAAFGAVFIVFASTLEAGFVALVPLLEAGLAFSLEASVDLLFLDGSLTFPEGPLGKTKVPVSAP